MRPVLRQKKPAPLKSLLHQFGVPTAGWVANRSLSDPRTLEGGQGAAVLDNFFPTSTKAILRRGKDLYATLGGEAGEDVTSLFTYYNGQNRRLFGSTATTIYDITSVASPFNWAIVNEDGDRIVTEDGDFFGQLSTGPDAVVYDGALGGN